MKRLRPISAFLLMAALAGIALCSCGYALRSVPSIDAVRIGEMLNRTTEPLIDARFKEALALELAHKGFRISRGAGYEVRGSIEKVTVIAAAETSDIDSYYEVTVSGSFRLVKPDGSSLPLAGSAGFIIGMSGAGSMRQVYANKESALWAALEDVAESVVDSLEGVK